MSSSLYFSCLTAPTQFSQMSSYSHRFFLTLNLPPPLPTTFSPVEVFSSDTAARPLPPPLQSNFPSYNNHALSFFYKKVIVKKMFYTNSCFSFSYKHYVAYTFPLNYCNFWSEICNFFWKRYNLLEILAAKTCDVPNCGVSNNHCVWRNNFF